MPRHAARPPPRCQALASCSSTASCSTTVAARGHAAGRRSGRHARQAPRASAPLGAAPGGGEAPEEAEDPGYLREYAALKEELLDSTRKCGAALGLYMLLTVDGVATLCAMGGCAAGYAYLQLLYRDVDAVSPTDTVPIWEANKIENPWLRQAAKLGSAYRAALRPRLLVLVCLAAAVGAYNAAAPQPLPLVYEGAVLGGFLSYKIALILRLVEELTPKSLGSSETSRPKIERIEDELDQWGRSKRPLTQSPLAVMPEQERAKAERQLEEQLQQQARREGGGGDGDGGGRSAA